MPAMNIRPSAAIRQNYNEIADLCRKTTEPVFLTKNGEGDLVVMDIDPYNRPCGHDHAVFILPFHVLLPPELHCAS